VAGKQDWSPDGKLILLTTIADWVRPRESANLVTIRPDGSGMTQLTQYTGRKENAFAGSFSPDGKQIVFRLERGDKYALATVDRNGENLRLLTKLSNESRGRSTGEPSGSSSITRRAQRPMGL
jgi:Tol biopolymer transport system component